MAPVLPITASSDAAKPERSPVPAVSLFIMLVRLVRAQRGKTPTASQFLPWRGFPAAPPSRYLVSTTGRIEWEYPAPSANDLWVLPNGNLLFNTGHGVREVTRAKEVVFDYQSTSEIYACQRLPDGRDGGHAYMRNARRLENGHYLVAHYGEQVVREYDAAGNAVMAIAANGGPHSAIRLSNGHTLISCGDMPGGSRVFEVDSSGKVVWQIQGDELPGISLKFVAGLQRLPHGNTVLCNWLGHGQFGRAPHLIEVTPDKRVVWTFGDHAGFKTVSSVQRLDLPRDAAPWQLAH